MERLGVSDLPCKTKINLYFDAACNACTCLYTHGLNFRFAYRHLKQLNSGLGGLAVSDTRVLYDWVVWL